MKMREATKERYKKFLDNLAVLAGAEATNEELNKLLKEFGVSFVLIQVCERAGFISRIDKKKFLVSANLVADEKTRKRLLDVYVSTIDAYDAKQKLKKAAVVPEVVMTNGTEAQMLREVYAVVKKIAERLNIKTD